MNRQLDYETKTHHYVRLSVTFAGGIQTYATAIIEVTDENDNPPTMKAQPALSRITPNFPVRSVVTDFDISDPDTGNSFTYTIIDGDEKQIFRVESNGQVVTRRCMTDADVGLYFVKVQVDDGVHKVSRAATVRIYRSEDMDFENHCGLDCRPFGNPVLYMFPEGLYVVRVKENVVYNAPIVQTRVPAFDNGTFALSSEAAGMFTINFNGSISAVRAFDYEQKRSHYFTVKARLPTRVTPIIVYPEVGVLVIVEDVDDNPPIVISQPSTVTVSELAQANLPIGCLKASDPDTDDSKLIYTVSSANNGMSFKIDQTGEIRTNGSMAAHVGQTITINYEVADGVNLPATGSINIQVVDVNDKLPMFSQNMYSFSTPENSPVGTSIGTVVATDSDTSAANNQVVYSISSSSQLFIIDPSTGVIRTNGTLDFETQKIHEFIVSASDGSSGRNVAIVKVNIGDINDNSPVINGGGASPQSLQVSVSEYTLPNTIIYTVQANDPDADDLLVFKLTQNSTIFEIDQTTGAFILKKQLYQYSTDTYLLDFTVSDPGNNVLNGRLTVNVQRSSINPCPVISGVGGNTLNLTEDQAVGSVVASLSRSNSIFYSPIEYSITNSDGFFNIFPNGTITLAKALDYESQRLHVLNINARDTKRGYASTVLMYVNVLDVNEGSPVITVDVLQVSELANRGTVVGSVQGTDVDKDAKLTYFIKNSNNDFLIDPNTGVLTVNTDFDAANKNKYDVEVCVSDGTDMTCKNITIDVADANNKVPAFGKYEGKFNVSINETANHTVGIITATDGDNSPITYSIEALDNADINDSFAIDPNTGRISLKKQVIAGVYNLFVCASDGAYRTCIPVKINVLGTDPTNPPAFSANPYGASIYSNTAMLTDIVRVYATDGANGDDNANIKYDIIAGNTNGVFEIGRTTGKIKLKKTPTSGFYNLTVKATNERTENTSTTHVYIAVGSPITDTNVFNPSTGGSGSGSGSGADGGSGGAGNGSYITSVVGTTMLVNFSIAEFNQAEVEHYIVVGQEVPVGQNISEATAKEPVSWYFAFFDPSYKYNRFLIGKVSHVLVVEKRTRRAVSTFFYSYLSVVSLIYDVHCYQHELNQSKCFYHKILHGHFTISTCVLINFIFIYCNKMLVL